MSAGRRQNILEAKMSKLGIRKSDLIERFVHSSSAGGSNVNKTSTCVYLKHIPTGLEVKCQVERYQEQNRQLAREILVRKIEERIQRKVESDKKIKAALLRQKRKRSAAQKARILESKRLRAQKKSSRQKIREFEVE